MLKNIIALLILVCLAACGDVSNPYLGSFSMPLTATTAHHTYRIDGSLLLFQNGVQLKSYDLTGTASSVTTEDLKPGTYAVYLNGGQVSRDGVVVPSTMTTVNPHSVTITAGENTVDTWNFNVAGDPVAFVCTPETCGDISETLTITEVPPTP